MTQAASEDLCLICGKPKAGHNYHHTWQGDKNTAALVKNDLSSASSSSEIPSSQRRVQIAPAGDPVLRLALIRKGIIAVEDLDSIEAELRGAGIAYHDPDSMDKPRDR